MSVTGLSRRVLFALLLAAGACSQTVLWAQNAFPDGALPAGDAAATPNTLAATNGYVIGAVLLAAGAIVLALLLRRRPAE